VVRLSEREGEIKREIKRERERERKEGSSIFPFTPVGHVTTFQPMERSSELPTANRKAEPKCEKE
jgi:hypothetical protein